MKSNTLKKIITFVAVAIPILTLTMPHFAYASCGFGIVGNSNAIDCIFVATSWIAELAFAAAGAILTLTGVLLNGTLVATLNIKQIVTNVTAIGIAWRTIRDFSSVFIIFMLLYASIKMILGLKDANLGNLIKNIIIAGLLINFSLFFTRLAIDTSNIISLSFYNAIAPGQNTVASSNSFNGAISSAFNDGGLSNVFMQSLSINKIVGANAIGAPGAGGDPNSNRTITLAYAGGTVLMLVAAGSFLFAAVAFSVRLGILILIMAFSPIYFIAMILPQAKQYADQWRDTLVAMCLFMPVYLFLMYVAVSVINDPHFFDFAKTSTTSGTLGNTLVTPSLVGIVLQYIIAFMFINAPMAAAIKIGSDGTDIAVKWGENAKKWGQGKLTTGSKWATGGLKAGGADAWRGTKGRTFNALAKSNTLKDFAKDSVVGEWALKGARGAAGDYQKVLDERAKKKVAFAESLGHDSKTMEPLQTQLRADKMELAKLAAQGKKKGDSEFDAVNTRVKNANIKITEVENARKVAYANRRGSKKNPLNSLFNSNVEAANAIHLAIAEKQLTKAKDKLKDTESEIKSLNNAITNSNKGRGGTATAAQTVKLTELLKSQEDQTKDVVKFEAEVDKLK